jgi:hypothetical protein
VATTALLVLFVLFRDRKCFKLKVKDLIWN